MEVRLGTSPSRLLPGRRADPMRERVRPPREGAEALSGHGCAYANGHQAPSSKQLWMAAKGESGSETPQTPKRGQGGGWEGGPPGRGTRERQGCRASCVSAAAHRPRLWGLKGCCLGQLGPIQAACHLPPLPPGSLPLRRPLCREAGDTCGDRCTVWWGWGSRFQGSRGLPAPSPGAHGLGSSSPSFLPSYTTANDSRSL